MAIVRTSEELASDTVRLVLRSWNAISVADARLPRLYKCVSLARSLQFSGSAPVFEVLAAACLTGKTGMVARVLRESLGAGRAFVVTAATTQRPVGVLVGGVAHVAWHTRPEGFIHMAYVRPGFRNRGVARLMLVAALAEIGRRGCDHAWGFAMLNNRTARAVWGALGGEPISLAIMHRAIDDESQSSGRPGRR